jgi:hypothetical protein
VAEIMNIFEDIADTKPLSELPFYKANIDEEDNNLYSSMLHVR